MSLSVKQKLKLRIFLLLAILLIAGVVCFNIPFLKINDFSNNSFLTVKELNSLQEMNVFGPFIKVKLKDESQVVNLQSRDSSLSNYQPEVEFKLFDLIPIKTQKVKIINDDKVIAGGNAVGLVLNTNGVLVVGSSPVLTREGEIDTLNLGILEKGDTILKIENETIDSVQLISKIINKEENKDRELTVEGMRNGKAFKTNFKPIFDIRSQNYKLGVWVRDDASGIGTLTYIDSKNRFGALGHAICDSDTKSIISLKSGKLYGCSILGVEKGESGKPGELKGLFMQGKNEQGVVEKNNEYGVFGSVKNESNYLKDFEQLEVGSRISVKPGKAQIRCCLNGTEVESFDIEIIKTNFQNYSNDKSMVLRVVDKDLIQRTGGIVQGMSGSPIIQNGKIVGAVTHVFVNDPTKGFGVYIDWMLSQ